MQITDTHIYNDPKASFLGLNSRESFDAVSQEIATQQLDIDCYLLTGDLIQDDIAESYDFLAKYFAAQPVPTYWIPGNHDTDALLQGRFSGGLISDSKLIENERWQVVLLNSRKPGCVEGYLAESELSYLEGILAASTKHTLVVLHHNPVTIDCGWLDPLGLENRDQFWKIIDRYPHVNAVLCGHIHQHFETHRGHVKIMATPSTSIQFLPKSTNFALDPLPPGCRYLVLEDNGVLDTKVMRATQFQGKIDPNAKGY